MNSAFTSAFMAGYLPLMQGIIAERSADWLNHDTVDLMVEAREITFDVAAAAARASVWASTLRRSR
jgi:cytochrome P450